MALVKKSVQTLQHPSEAETWFKVRVPLSAGDLEQMRADGSTVGMSLDLMTEVIAEWSFPEAITLDNVRLLDIDSFVWLSGEIQNASGIKSDDEKKDSALPSLPSNMEASSLQNSAI